VAASTLAPIFGSGYESERFDQYGAACRCQLGRMFVPVDRGGSVVVLKNRCGHPERHSVTSGAGGACPFEELSGRLRLGAAGQVPVAHHGGDPLKDAAVAVVGSEFDGRGGRGIGVIGPSEKGQRVGPGDLRLAPSCASRIGQGQGLVGEIEGAGMVADLPSPAAGMSQRQGTQKMNLGAGHAECDPRPRPWFGPNVVPRVPEERGHDAQREVAVLRRDGERERGAQVGAGGAEAGGDLELVRPEQGVGQGSAQSGVVAGVAVSCQPFGTVLAERLEQPKGGRLSQVGDNHGLVDQRRHDVDDIVAERRPGDDRVGAGYVEAAGEDGEPPERCSFVVVEQSPAPVERGAQCLVPLDCAVASRREDVQVLIESGCELGQS
jgi:hypothetical protein